MIQTWDEIAADVRVVARKHGWRLTREQVSEAVRQHLNGKAYFDAILAARKRPGVRDRKANAGYHLRERRY